jgi:hypothetical protein
MKQFMIRALATLSLAASAVAQPIPLFENFGIINTNIQIDAFAFANYGTFSVSTILPYDFQNTRYFTNRGTMRGSVGFDFSTAFSLGPNQPATNFVNARGAQITAESGGFFFPGVGGSLSPSFLLVNAENITNEGILVAGAAGLIRLTGRNVNLRRGGIGIGNINMFSSHFVTTNSFNPDPGINDLYWGGIFEQGMGVAGLMTLTPFATNVSSGPHLVTNAPTYFLSSPNIQIMNPLVAVFTNQPTPTNIIRQAVFVGLSDPNFTAAVRFSQFGNPYRNAIVQISLPDIDPITGDPGASSIYLLDQLATSTNYVMLENLASAPPTYRPANYQLTRQPPFQFFTGIPGDNVLTNTFFFDPADTNFSAVVTNLYAAYSAQIDTLAGRPPNVPLLEVTELPGRIEIHAANLDMERARLRGSGLISINTLNLVGSPSPVNANVDGENISFNVGVSSGTLNVEGLAKESVVRLSGTVRAWSAIWTNFFGITETNTFEEPPGSGEFTNVVTNIVTEIGYHVLMVDARGLSSLLPVTTHDLILRGESVVINDSITVVRKMIVDAERFTLNGNLTMLERVGDLFATNFPGVMYFTNNGTLFVNNAALFNQGRREPYQNFVNNGEIDVVGMVLNTDYFENSGTIRASGTFFSPGNGVRVTMNTGLLEGGQTLSEGDATYNANQLRFHRYTNILEGALFLTVPSGLADSGPDAGNLWTVQDGFHLTVKPRVGDLLGTRIDTFAPRFAAVEHTWAAEDRGPTVQGFQNNAAIGELRLDVGPLATLVFSPANGNNAMYVDSLVFENAVLAAFQRDDLESVLEISPGMVIYFASANVPAEELDGRFDGRLRWVGEFVGPNSSVDVARRSGVTEQRNRSERDSTVLDWDNDGIANAYDPFPLDPDPLVLLTNEETLPDTISFSWHANARTVYRVEYTHDVDSRNWQVLTQYTNSAATAKTATVQDRVSSGQAQKYYRVQSVQQLQ